MSLVNIKGWLNSLPKKQKHSKLFLLSGKMQLTFLYILLFISTLGLCMFGI